MKDGGKKYRRFKKGIAKQRPRKAPDRDCGKSSSETVRQPGFFQSEDEPYQLLGCMG